jgi:hypothetical protein
MEAATTPGKSRKRDKVRSAWISFAGRIVAQLIGAIATVTLGVVVLGKAHAPAAALELAAAARPTVLVATPVRTHGETVIVMLPVGRDGTVDQAMATEIAETFEKSRATRLADALPQTPTDPPFPQSGDPSVDTREIPASPRE